MKKMSLYLDTSVIGGYFDKEFEKPTQQLFALLRSGVYQVFVSEITIYELRKAPGEFVVKVIDLLSELEFERPNETEESTQLAQAYIKAKVLPANCMDDARHVAIATCENLNYIVSWNFKHLVNVGRIRGFNAVNLRYGYSLIDIRTPWEVMGYGNERI